MEITDVDAVLCEPPITLSGLPGERTRPIVIATVDTDDGITGYGVTGMTFESSTPRFVAEQLRPLLLGMDPLRIEHVWERLHTELNRYEHTGVWSTAMSAIDIALWDIAGKRYGEPVWRLLGGTRESLETMATPGIAAYSRSQLVGVFEDYVARGHTRLKMQVGRQDPPDSADDEARITAVRDAIGGDVELAIDANEYYPVNQAMELCTRVRDRDIAFFEEPVRGNDPELLASLRRRSGIPISAGQNEGSPRRHHEFMAAGAIDIVQPNVSFVGGFTGARKVAAMAEARNLLVANGGGNGHLNMHLIAGIRNGWCVEFNPLSWTALAELFVDLPTPDGDRIALPDDPGIGLEPDHGAVEEYRVG